MCSAHTEAQPRERSPIRQDASRSILVRWRPRKISVAQPIRRSASEARCTVRIGRPVHAARVALDGRQWRPVVPSAYRARASATFITIARETPLFGIKWRTALYRKSYATGT
ncbi:hypothetical protein [Mycobacteroides abscessus]|uniref:hypothetical protein n=1 Tax=Mycobacteroides abscessus TaxID=36809 RepID=UPI001F15AAB6|nr:hypothetical protein [Mycobacteroides abscessus]MDM3940779.1 hypothetical protein [Mycobacteroides abscessus]MDO3057017.1 hypothetical protein [Mycobacteroides abscessus subsp. massiliense]